MTISVPAPPRRHHSRPACVNSSYRQISHKRERIPGHCATGLRTPLLDRYHRRTFVCSTKSYAMSSLRLTPRAPVQVTWNSFTIWVNINKPGAVTVGVYPKSAVVKVRPQMILFGSMHNQGLAGPLVDNQVSAGVMTISES
jgi:hypothetical protein